MDRLGSGRSAAAAKKPKTVKITARKRYMYAEAAVVLEQKCGLSDEWFGEKLMDLYDKVEP